MSKFWKLCKAALIFLLLVLVVSLIWWGGPDIRLGESRPLEPVLWRLGLILFILFLVISPLLLRMLSWLWQRFSPQASGPLAQDPEEAACAELLGQVQHFYRQHGATVLQRCWGWFPFFSPHYVCLGSQSSISKLIDRWPDVIDWDSNTTPVGRVLITHGQCWLFFTEDQVRVWAIYLKNRTSAKAMVVVVPSEEWRHPQGGGIWATTIGQVLAVWKKNNHRLLSVWILSTTRPVSAPPPHPDDVLPWGFVLPSNPKHTASALSECSSEFLHAFRTCLLNPDYTTDSHQELFLLADDFQNDLLHTQLFVNKWNRLGVLRGFFWAPQNNEYSLPCFNHFLKLLRSDQQTSMWVFKRRLMGWGVVSFFMLAICLWTFDQTVLRSLRHAAAQKTWLSAVSKLSMETAAFANYPAPLSQLLPVFNQLDSMQSFVEQQLQEPLPDVVSAWTERVRGDWLLRYLLPRLHLDNLAFMAAQKNPDAETLYNALAFGSMLDQPRQANTELLNSVLSQWGLNIEQKQEVLHHLKYRPSNASFTQNPAFSQYADWRVYLSKQENFSLDMRIWSGILNESQPSRARDLDLTALLGPSASWFSEGDKLAWIFTFDGLNQGVRPAYSRFEEWGEEYYWVVFGRQQTLSLDDLDALNVKMHLLYAKKAIQAWNEWFTNIAVVPPKDVAEAVALAQLFSSDESPLVRLLSSLEQTMPFPNKKNTSWLQRIGTRVKEDWAQLQFQLGWRRSPRPSLPSSDPALLISNAFVQLQNFFADIKGKSAARERMQNALRDIASYLEKVSSAQQLGIKPPPKETLLALRGQVNKWPAPLKSIGQSMVFLSEEKTKQSMTESLGRQLTDLSSFKRCQLALDFPYNPKSSTDQPWIDFVEDFSPQGAVAKLHGLYADPVSAVSLDRDQQWLEQAWAIRHAWFPSQGPALQFSFKPVFLSPEIRMVKIRMGEELWVFAHGEEVERRTFWPPMNGFPAVEIEVTSVKNDVFKQTFDGQWALLRWMHQATQTLSDDPRKWLFKFVFPSGTLEWVVTTEKNKNPFDVTMFKNLCKY
jgi:type VI protein secretion system component VasK